MTLRIFDIPDNAEQTLDWLEDQLVGLDLGEIVSGLEAVHGTDGIAVTLESVCGSALPRVLNEGLRALTPEQRAQLLKHPHLLLDLQEKIFVEGGDYWHSRPASEEHRELVADEWKSLAGQLSGSSGSVQPTRQGETASSPQRHWVRTLVALAAAVIVGVGIWQFMPAQPKPGWGWDKPGALASNLPAPQYLNGLADSANDWFKKRPDTKEALQKRLQEFRHGCDTLIAAPHPQLAAADRNWLRERCKVWSGKLDGHLKDLADGKDVLEIRTQADDTVNKLIAAIRDRAGKVA